MDDSFNSADYGRNPQLRELQLAELDVLRYTINVLDENGIHWYLGYGTLLGAIRHHGFIPWDDDIDIFIPRPDYEILMQKAPLIIKSPYSLFDPTKQQTITSSYLAAVQDTRLKISRPRDNEKVYENVHIDIFPLDGISSLKPLQVLLFCHLRLLYYMMRAARFSQNSLEGNSENNKERSLLEKTGILLINKFTGWGNRHTVTEVASKFHKFRARHSFEEANYVYAFTYDFGRKKSVFPKEWLGDGRKTSFENIEMNIPEQSEKLLTRIYGDYMKLPEPEQRHAKHDYEIISSEHDTAKKGSKR